MNFVDADVQRFAERHAAALLALIALLLGGSAFALSQQAQATPTGRLLPLPKAVSPQAGTADAASGFGPASAPVGIAIPAIGVTAHVVDVGLDGHGSLVPPTDVKTVGWYDAGAVPGAGGPAVLAGHVDSNTGPAVFWRLRDLAPGDLVTITDTEQRDHRFVVTAVEQYPKDAFPTAKVYGAQTSPVLRLVTCGGTFNTTTKHYRDNVVVYAVQIA